MGYSGFSGTPVADELHSGDDFKEVFDDEGICG